jgi:hypothetical protein
MLQAMAVLHGPNSAQKAQVWAAVGRAYGLDPELLSQAWNGTLQPQAGHPSGSMDPRAIAEHAAQYARQAIKEEQQQVVLGRAYAEVNQHAQRLEFFDELRNDMAAIMDSYTARKRPITIEAAYEKALDDRPELKGILDQRQRATASRMPNPAVLRAKAASSSIRGTPAPPPPPRAKKPGLDGALDAAWETLVARHEVA